MARPGAGGLNVGRAALLIVVALVIGVFVLNQGDDVPSASSFDLPTNTTVDLPDLTSPTTVARAASSPTTLATRAPSSFKSIAINATNTSGVAAKATTRLTTAGYNALAPGDATASVKANTKSSLVMYAAGFQREAAVVASLFGLPASAVVPITVPPPSTSVKDASIVVLVGPGLAL